MNTNGKQDKLLPFKFLNEDSYLQDKVKQYASIWPDYADLKSEYVNPDENADIRISFDNSGSY